MVWTVMKIPTEDLLRFQDELGMIMMAKTAVGDRTSFIVHSHFPLREPSRLYFSPEAAELFKSRLMGIDTTTADELPEGCSVFINAEWPD